VFLKFLELSDFFNNGYRLTSYFDIGSYSDKPLQLLLPVNIGDGHYRYTTSGLVLMSLIDKIWSVIFSARVSMYLTFFTLSFSLIIITFMIVYRISGSLGAAATLALCMAFGTQFNSLYANTSILILYQFCVFLLVNLYYIFLIISGKKTGRGTKAAYIISLVFVALCWEMWLDYAVFMYAVFVLLFWLYKRSKISLDFKNLRFCFAGLTIILITYLLVKINSSQGVAEHFEHGKEGETVMNYLKEPDANTSVIFAEDIISNIITYNYISLSNYFPPSLLSSNASFYFGKGITKYQYGYHPEAQHFVYYHYIFYWYYFAGALFVLYLLLLYRSIKNLFKGNNSGLNLILVTVLLMIFFGSFTHLFIKYRPYLSVPLLGYKCVLGIFAGTLLIGVGIVYLKNKLPAGKYYVSTLIICLVVVYGGFARPQRLSQLGREVMPGTMYAVQPDPMKATPISTLRQIKYSLSR
jgi:hypothetical protein